MSHAKLLRQLSHVNAQQTVIGEIFIREMSDTFHLGNPPSWRGDDDNS